MYSTKNAEYSISNFSDINSNIFEDLQSSSTEDEEDFSKMKKPKTKIKAKAFLKINKKKLWFLLLVFILFTIGFSIFLLNKKPKPLVGENFWWENVLYNQRVLSSSTCENTKQGRIYIADSAGYVCKRKNIDPSTNCCPTINDFHYYDNNNTASSVQYLCCGCSQTKKCCSEYENCVSCCMNPETVNSLISEITKLKPNTMDPESLNPFQVCSAACRTSSSSVLHENQFKNESAKYCFTIEPKTESPMIEN